ncbi:MULTISPECIES: DUF5988 family protein [Streptomyces]|uniref:DUF5988 family protein n=1 Tax=Streptomyces TaxID=1883 RepID=UPI0004CD263B|nr:MULTISPECIES: DUF5988 family protein [Streptomyces]KOT48714.1 hypothetical protein ADK43_37495 [Streptomyces rimosus subsp. rimosus]
MNSVSGVVVLRDGPVTLEGIRQVAACLTVDSERAIVAHCGNNEHFTRSEKTEIIDGESVRIYVWSYTTAIAE